MFFLRKIVRRRFASSSVVIEVLSKPNCGLCDQVEFALQRMLENASISEQCILRKVNIEKDPQLWDQFQWSIPVVRVNRTHVFLPQIDIPAISQCVRDELHCDDHPQNNNYHNL